MELLEPMDVELVLVWVQVLYLDLQEQMVWDFHEGLQVLEDDLYLPGREQEEA